MNLRRKILKSVNYSSDQKGIINRYIGEKGGWDMHLKNCRDYILDGVSRSGCKTVTVLGSGWALDIPLEELNSMCRKVWLVDICHPRQIALKAGRMKNVELVGSDITGGVAEMIIDSGWKRFVEHGSVELPEYRPAFKPGLIISSNILTQLDSLVIDYLVKKTGMKREHFKELSSRMQSAHIELLRNYPSVLITETAEHVFLSGEHERSGSLLFCELPAGDRIKKWKWNFDTRGTYYSKRKVTFDVSAIMLNI